MADDTKLQHLQEKIDQLNKQAWDIRVNDSTQAYQLSKEAIDLAEPVNYAKGMAEGYRTFGFCLIRLSRHQEALEFLNKSLPLFESLNDLDGQASLYAFYGIIQCSFGNYAASLDFLFRYLELSQQTGNTELESLAFYHLGVTYKYLGNYEQALDHFVKSLSIAQANNHPVPEAYSINNIGLIYLETEDFTNALEYFFQSLAIRRKSGDKWGEAGSLDNIGFTHFKLKDYDKALEFCSQALSISQAIGDKKGQGNAFFHLGNIYKELADYNNASASCDSSLSTRRDIEDKKGEAEVLLFLAALYINDKFAGRPPQQIFELLDKALELGEEIKALDLLAKIHSGYYAACKHFNHHQEALAHLETHISLAKEIHSNAINHKIQNLEISHKAEKSRKEAEIYRLRNVELAALYEEGKKQKEEIQSTLTELKITQAQLIQSEKMASLGELTAGIAHEIQNPLNFINNFSDVNSELIEELQNELRAGNTDEAILISNDLKDNEEKIAHHGKRADAIVKGMLQHSRTSSGQKEPTDINALADEYLRLAYQGQRAKDKSFNVKLITDFDPSIEKINIVPQDIGRVLLNLYSNAFYAAPRPLEASPDEPVGGGGYNKNNPTVWVTTTKKENKVVVSVRDNGPGISKNIIDKIFQPFFTTKPTGQGTGLGLSLSYDIIKAHGGEMKVETKEGEGSVFSILLPLN